MNRIQIGSPEWTPGLSHMLVVVGQAEPSWTKTALWPLKIHNAPSFQLPAGSQADRGDYFHFTGTRYSTAGKQHIIPVGQSNDSDTVYIYHKFWVLWDVSKISNFMVIRYWQASVHKWAISETKIRPNSILALPSPHRLPLFCFRIQNGMHLPPHLDSEGDTRNPS